MSFGFSVGDFLALATLIAEITNSLRDTGGARSDYQELIRELEGLDRALRHIDVLQSNGASQKNLDSIKYAALSCRQPLEEFLGQIRAYELALGIRHDANVLKSTAHKLSWSFGKKDRVRRLQSYLSVHVGTINMLLTEYGLEKMDLATDRAELDGSQLREKLDSTRGVLQCVKDQVVAQALVVRNTQSMLAQLFQMVSGELRASITSLADMVAKACISTQQTYSIVLELKRSMSTVDTRWTFFQAPLLIEDALGFKFPVPSEYDFSLLDMIVRHRFQEGEGSLDVKFGNYELFKTKNSKQVISADVRLLPGTEITMAIIVSRPVSNAERCPMPRCGSSINSPAPGGGLSCGECGVWYDQATKKRRALEEFFDILETIQDETKVHGITESRVQHRPGPVQDSTAFKNVRWSTVEEIEVIENEYEHEAEEAGSPDSFQAPILNDALDYLDQIKIIYADDPSVYESFLDIIKDFQSNVIDTPVVIDRVALLFAESPSLIEGFNLFLPKGHSMKVASSGQLTQVKSPIRISNSVGPAQKRKRKGDVYIMGLASPRPSKVRKSLTEESHMTFVGKEEAA